MVLFGGRWYVLHTVRVSVVNYRGLMRGATALLRPPAAYMAAYMVCAPACLIEQLEETCTSACCGLGDREVQRAIGALSFYSGSTAKTATWKRVRAMVQECTWCR